MNLSKTSIMRPVSTIMLMMIIVVLGAVSFSKLPIDLYPKMELPYAMVIAGEAWDASAPTSTLTEVIYPSIGAVTT